MRHAPFTPLLSPLGGRVAPDPCDVLMFLSPDESLLASETKGALVSTILWYLYASHTLHFLLTGPN